MFFGARLLLRIWAMARGQNSKRAKHALTPQSQSFQIHIKRGKWIKSIGLPHCDLNIWRWQIMKPMATCSLPQLRSNTRWRVVSLQCAVCTFGNRAGRKQLRCCALLASPPPPLYCNASSHFALVRLASTGSAMAGPSSTAKLVPARNKSWNRTEQSRPLPNESRPSPARSRVVQTCHRCRGLPRGVVRRWSKAAELEFSHP